MKACLESLPTIKNGIAEESDPFCNFLTFFLYQHLENDKRSPIRAKDIQFSPAIQVDPQIPWLVQFQSVIALLDL